MRSPFDLNNHPPADAPVGVICPGLWTVQVRWWKRHTPNPGEKKCTECAQSWPCHSWLCWDGQIGDAWDAATRYQRAHPAALNSAAPLLAGVVLEVVAVKASPARRAKTTRRPPNPEARRAAG